MWKLPRDWMALGLAAAVFAIAPGSSHAAPPAAAQLSAAQLSEREQRDAPLVQAAFDDWRNNPESGLAPHLRTLHEVLDRAPAVYPLLEKHGAITISRGDADDESNALMLAIMATGEPKGDVSIVLQPNVYGQASFLLGWHYNHVKAYGEALKVLDHGLALQPDNPALVSEKGAALAVQRRFAEALTLYDDWFARQAGPEDTHRYARLLRARGFALIELKRLDEAEAAYRQALEIEPDNAGAKHELAYIAELRAGQAGPKAIGLFRSDEAAKKAPD